jgi:hypothetical protein
MILLTKSITHARIISLGNTDKQTTINVTYELGSWNGTTWISAELPHVSLTMSSTDSVNTQSALENLFNAGVVPTPGNPTSATTVATKKAGDFKSVDVDAVVAGINAVLAGSVV